MPVTGLLTVETLINHKIERLRYVSAAGLLAGGLIIKGEAQKRVPREYSFLFNSAFSRRVPGPKKTVIVVAIGFNKAYAAYVHENIKEKLRGKKRPSGLGTYWSPGGSKYLEKGAKASVPKVLAAVKAYARKA